MRGKKKTEAYLPEALEFFGKQMLNVRKPSNSKTQLNNVQVKLDGLEAAVRALDKKDREHIEKFWGLTGGPNHSKKIGNCAANDVAFKKMADTAISALNKLLALDYAIMYDTTVEAQINLLARKINKKGLEISDVECVKYLIAFFIYVDNGPKMPFEEEPMSVDTDLDEDFIFDESVVLNQMCKEMTQYVDGSIDIRFVMGFFEMMDLKDMLSIKKSVGIEIPKETLPDELTIEDIEIVKTVSGVRKLKERVFPYGAWQVSTSLIVKDEKENINLNDFMNELNSIRQDWTKVAQFKVGERALKTMSELRTLAVYNIGGLEFTDAYEVMFLYLERNLIAPEV